MNSHSRGYALLAAIFIMLLLSTMGIALLQFFNQEQATYKYDSEYTKAGLALNSGLAIAQTQWEKQPQTCPQIDNALQGFKVTISCSQLIHSKTADGAYDGVKLIATVQKSTSHGIIQHHKTRLILLEN